MSGLTLNASAPATADKAGSVVSAAYRAFLAVMVLAAVIMLGLVVTGNASLPTHSFPSIQKSASIQSAPATFTNRSSGGVLS